MNNSSVGDPRVPLAVERTLFAWIRTGLALMGFGFFVSRFGLFLREIESPRGAPLFPGGVSVVLGALFLLAGAIVNIAAAAQHGWGRGPITPTLKLAICVAAFTGVLGVALTAYVVFY